MRAVEYALKHQDTDVFWNLHCWTNVPPSSARSYKAAFHQIFFNNNPSLRPHYSQFELRPLPAGSKTEIRRNDGILIKPNISVLGLVGFNGGDIEYGKDLDGYYWLVPKVKIPLQNPQTAPAE